MINRGRIRLILTAALALTLLVAVAVPQEAKEEYTYEEYSYYNKAKAETDLAKKEAAIFEFLEKFPHSTLTNYVMAEFQAWANAAIQKGSHDQVIAASTRLREMVPGSDVPVQALASAYYFKQDFPNYLANSEILYAKQPNVQMAYYMADAAIKCGDTVRAEKYLGAVEQEGALLMKVDLAYKLYGYYAGKNDPKTIETAQKVIALLEGSEAPADFKGDWAAFKNGTLAVCYSAVGNSQLKASNFTAAAETFEKVVKVNPKDAASYFYLGLSYWFGKQAKAAAPAFAKAAVLNQPISAKAAEQLYKLLEGAGLAEKYDEYIATAKTELGIQ
ncbi:MAG TPA: tetratricopeptide repeat protein [Acidobacteriota bacterium]|nr:tetratricopeptide repeat protein [Acidobacteriota bacterium]HOB54474.1 tetratricopeptide repeat protein [Acidobacteriota bacterium]HQM64809.1 tetratricopeptide repeat protein [Acidobacteriota bacterium]